MRLISCYIDNFGLLNETKIDFNRGLNCFCSLNSTGKTTLTVFIKAMLYGFKDNRTSKEENERKKYNPWQGGRYGGSITFEADGGTFIAERTFGAKPSDDSFVLRDAKTGGVSNYYTENLGEELFGIDRDGFVRTVFLSERSISSSDRISGSVASKLSDIMGSDGDVGNYEKAKKSLDERRKLYQKRGGGEIDIQRARIAEQARRLDELDLLTDKAEGMRTDIADKKAKIDELRSECEAHNVRLSEIRAIRDRRKYRVKYDEILDEIMSNEGKLAELSAFFGGVIPSEGEIDSASAAKLEADMILSELGRNAGDSELIRLAEFFAPLTGISELDEAEAVARGIEDSGRRLDSIRSGEDERSREMRDLFPARLPRAEEIEANIQLAKSGAGRLPSVLLILGAMVIAAGVALGFVNPALFTVCAVGAILAIVGPIVGAIKKGRAVAIAREFLYEIEPAFSGDVLGKLYEKKNDLDRYARLAELKDGEEQYLVEKIDTGRDYLNKFLAKFGIYTEDYTGALSTLRKDYQRYSMLSLSEENSADSRSQRLSRAKELNAKASAFLARFPVSSLDPFGEIRRKATDYLYLSSRTEQLREEASRFAHDYGITEVPESYDEAEEIRLNTRISEIDGEINRLNREVAVLEGQYNDLINEIETKDDVIAAKTEAEERLAAAERSYENIKLTMAILDEAYNNMTLRYTGKTRERFLYYVNKISGAEGDYRIDTDFEITKVERGALRDEDCYSRGTKDLYSLAMRLALTDSLYDGELPFLVLDDPFIALDDEKCKRAKEMLSSIATERQILYFTCSDSRSIK